MHSPGCIRAIYTRMQREGVQHQQQAVHEWCRARAEEQHEQAVRYQQFGPLGYREFSFTVIIRNTPACSQREVELGGRGGRRRGRKSGNRTVLHTRHLSMRGGTDTYSVLQQLLGVVDCTDDSCSPTASTAMRVTAGLLVEGSGGHTAFSSKNISKNPQPCIPHLGQCRLTQRPSRSWWQLHLAAHKLPPDNSSAAG